MSVTCTTNLGEISTITPHQSFKTKNLVEIFTYTIPLRCSNGETFKPDEPERLEFCNHVILVYSIVDGYRVEVIDSGDDFYYHPGIFPDLEDAIMFAHISFHSPNPCALYCNDWLGGNSEIVFWTCSHYKGWFVWGFDNYEIETFDPLTNRCYVRETLPEIYKLIDTIQAARCEPSLMLI